jgi:hypothetical protein
MVLKPDLLPMALIIPADLDALAHGWLHLRQQRSQIIGIQGR